MNSLKLAALALASAAIMASNQARALTYDTHNYRNPDGTSKFQDPDDNLHDGSGDKGSGFSMQFSSGSSGGSLYPDSSSRLFLPQSGVAASPNSGSDGYNSSLGNRHW